MLVLSRKENESVIIKLPDGREVVVMLTAIRGDRVRLGFEAPKDIVILRQEVAPFVQ